MSSIMEKTAIQQLISECENIKNTQCKTLQEVVFFDAILVVIESKYLAIEKEQIKEAYDAGRIDGDWPSSVSEKYYIETYGK